MTGIEPVVAGIVLVVIPSPLVAVVNPLHDLPVGKGLVVRLDPGLPKFQRSMEKDPKDIGIVGKEEVGTAADDNAGLGFRHLLDDLGLEGKEVLRRNEVVGIRWKDFARIDVLSRAHHLPETDSLIGPAEEGLVDAGHLGSPPQKVPVVVGNLQVIRKNPGNMIASAALLPGNRNHKICCSHNTLLSQAPR